MIRICLLIYSFLTLSHVFALAPIESLILGDFKQEYIETQNDPLNYVFRRDPILQSKVDEDQNQKHFEQMVFLKGFAWEGENLKQSCHHSSNIRYRSDWEATQVKRSIAATLQYIGLDMTIRSLAQYAKYFEFSEDEYKNFSERLVGNFCSKNISIISLREIRNNLMIKFSKGDFTLPSITNSPFFPHQQKFLLRNRKHYEREFDLTVKLFRAFCSWDGQVESFRLLNGILKNPGLYAFIVRQMTKRKVKYDDKNRRMTSTYDPNTIQVGCENLICRRMTEDIFDKVVPKSLGSNNYTDDFNRMYCQHFAGLDYYPREDVQQVNNWIKKTSIDEHRLLNGQFMALLTGVPDFMIGLDTFDQGKDLFKSSIEQTWNDWADFGISKLKDGLYHEEALTVELVDRDFYFDRSVSDFKVQFDVNLGEFDRSTQILGKISASFNIELFKNFLIYIRREWQTVDPRDEVKKNTLYKMVRSNIAKKVKESKKLFVLAPWSSNLEGLIADEIIYQIVTYEGKFFRTRNENEKVTIPVVFNYGLFALKYISYTFNVKKQLELITDDLVVKKKSSGLSSDNL